jgi:hypothetical protein
MDTSTNLLNEIIEDKPAIDPTFYYNAIKDGINRYIIELQYNPDKLNANHYNAIFNHLYHDIFKPDHTKKLNPKCDIPYTKHNIQTLLNVYMSVCLDCNIPPSAYGFCLLTHLDDETVKRYLTDASTQILNARKEYTRNKLFDNNLGLTVLANNDTSIGLLYTRQNTIESQAIRQGLSLSDLKPITDNRANT